MNDFIHSCNAAATYPKNLISPSDYQHTLQRYVNDLDEREARLFGVEDRATVNFVDLDDGATSTSCDETTKTSKLNLLIKRTEAGRLQKHVYRTTGIAGLSSVSTAGPSNWSNMQIYVREKCDRDILQLS